MPHSVTRSFTTCFTATCAVREKRGAVSGHGRSPAAPRRPAARTPRSPAARRPSCCPRTPCRSRRCPAPSPPGTLCRKALSPLSLGEKHSVSGGSNRNNDKKNHGKKKKKSQKGATSVRHRALGFFFPPKAVFSGYIKAQRRSQRSVPGGRILTGRWSMLAGLQMCASEPNLESSILRRGSSRLLLVSPGSRRLRALFLAPPSRSEPGGAGAARSARPWATPQWSRGGRRSRAAAVPARALLSRRRRGAAS